MSQSWTQAAAALAVLALLSLAACQKSGLTRDPSPEKSASLKAMEPIAIAAHKCWFASKDEAFRAYRMANELNSFGGVPRFLIVPAENYEGLPLLVVQAEGDSNEVHFFGPLLNAEVGARIKADLHRWQIGNFSCTRSS